MAAHRSRRTAPPRRPLSRERIAEAALALVDAEGLEALAMRPLASRLGVEAMSLYKHFASRAEIVDAVVELVLARIPVPERSLAPDERLIRLAMALRDAGKAHPHVFPLLANRMPGSPSALAPVEALLAAFSEAGLPDAEVASAFWMLVGYVVGAVLGELGSGAEAPRAAPSYAASHLDPRVFPSFVRLSPRLADCDPEEEFHWGLARVIAIAHAGPRAQRRRARRPKPKR